MSVPVTMMIVHKPVPTLLVATHVDATLDMSWMEMDSLAMVKWIKAIGANFEILRY